MNRSRFLLALLCACVWNAGIAHALPPTPAGFVADAPTACGTIRLSWTPVAGVDGYNLYRNGALQASLGQSANEFFDFEMPGPAVYAYSIESFDESGVSPAATDLSTLPNPEVIVEPWDWFHDLFPTADAAKPPGAPLFARTTAKPRTGRNTAPLVGGLGRMVTPAANAIVLAPGAVGVDIHFRIKPGPGNYAVIGLPATGLLWDPAFPFGPVACAGDASFWGPYIGGPACPGMGVWDPLQWNTVACDALGGDRYQTTAGGAPIFPDDLFTPGTVVQYYFEAEYAGGAVVQVPNTNCVMQVRNQGSIDGHRWEQFTVLPDLWKDPAFGGLGLPCALVVDLEDGRGNERVWAGIADSIAATHPGAYGGYNGWHALAGVLDPDDPASFVNLNRAAGTTWDLYSVRGWQSNASGYAGALGGRLGVVPAGSFPPGPTPAMLSTYYKMLVLLSGDRDADILGPVIDRSQDDVALMTGFLTGSAEGNPRGLLAAGNGFVTSEDLNHPAFLGLLEVDLRAPSYKILSGSPGAYSDVLTGTPITTNGDIYGVHSVAAPGNDVLSPLPGGVMASRYEDVGLGAPYAASVFRDVDPGAGEFWLSLTEGWNIRDLGGRFRGHSAGRLANYYNVFSNIFGSICAIAGPPPVTTDVDPTLVPATVALKLRNNPLRSGEAEIAFTLGAPDRVESAVFDLSGRRVRELGARTFEAGSHGIRWNGTGSDGRLLPAGVYRIRVRFESLRETQTRSLVVMR